MVKKTLTPPPCLFTTRDRDVTSGSYNDRLTTNPQGLSRPVMGWH